MTKDGGEANDYEIRAMAVATMQVLDLNDALIRRYDNEDTSDESYTDVTAAARGSKILNRGLAKVFEWDEQDFYEVLYANLLGYAKEQNIKLSKSLDLFMSGMAYGVD